MAIAVTRLGGAQATGANPHNITLPSTANVGDLIVLCFAAKTGSSQSVSSVSGLGATWVAVNNGFVAGANSRAEIWYGVVVTAGTAVTVTPTTAFALSWDAFAVTGYNASSVIQAQSANGTSSGDATVDATISMGSPAPTVANNVAIAVASIASTAAGTFSALTTGWTQGMAFGGSSTLHPAYSAYRLNTPTGATALVVTRSATASDGYAWVVINEAAAPAAGTRYRAII